MTCEVFPQLFSVDTKNRYYDYRQIANARLPDDVRGERPEAAKEQHAKSTPRRGERLAMIAKEGNRKKSEAAKGNVNAAKDRQKTDASHDDMRVKKSGKNVALPARAAEAKVSPATINLVSNCSNLFHLSQCPKNILYTPTK